MVPEHSPLVSWLRLDGTKAEWSRTMSGSCVLIVESDRDVAQDLAVALRGLGYRVMGSAHDGHAAIESFSRVRPDVVLVDLQLRGTLDGIATASRIHERWRVPVVFMAGESDADLMDRAARMAPSGLVAKPIQPSELHGALEVALQSHRIEARLGEDVRWFSAVLRSIGDAVVVTDANGDVTYLNPVAERLTRWSLDEARGRTIEDVVPLLLGDRAAHPHPVRWMLGHGAARFVESELELLARDGTRTPIADSVCPVHDDEGRFQGTVIALRDVSASRRLEDQLRHASKLEAIGRLAGGIAHDFNNLLTVILGHSGLLRTAPLGAEERTSVGEIHKAADRARELVLQLLAYGRKQPVAARVLDLDALLLEWRDPVQRLIGEQVRLDLCVGPGAHCVLADPTQLQQIVLNLAANARDAMPDGGTMHLTTSTRTGRPLGRDASNECPARPAPRQPRENSKWVVLTVRDSGAGMDEQTRARMFEPYFTTKESGHGTGLGLATVYGIVKQNDGYIEVESAPGGGTTFEIGFPDASRP